MRIIQNITNLEEVLSSEKILPVDATKLDTYVGVNYACGCGSEHNIAGNECLNVLSAKTVRVLLRCENDYYTFVQVKGLFRLQTISHWAFQADLVERPDNEPPYVFRVDTKSWVEFFTKDKARMMMLGRKMGMVSH